MITKNCLLILLNEKFNCKGNTLFTKNVYWIKIFIFSLPVLKQLITFAFNF